MNQELAKALVGAVAGVVVGHGAARAGCPQWLNSALCIGTMGFIQTQPWPFPRK